MATVTITTCDKRTYKEEGTVLVNLATGGNSLVLDLCAKHGQELVDLARPAPTTTRGYTKTKARGSTGVSYNDVRLWAKGQGLQVAERGRPRKELVDKYEAAQK